MSDEGPGLLERMVELDNLRKAYAGAQVVAVQLGEAGGVVEAAAEVYIEALEAECRRVGVIN